MKILVMKILGILVMIAGGIVAWFCFSHELYFWGSIAVIVGLAGGGYLMGKD